VPSRGRNLGPAQQGSTRLLCCGHCGRSRVLQLASACQECAAGSAQAPSSPPGASCGNTLDQRITR